MLKAARRPRRPPSPYQPPHHRELPASKTPPVGVGRSAVSFLPVLRITVAVLPVDGATMSVGDPAIRPVRVTTSKLPEARHNTRPQIKASVFAFG